MQVLHLTARPSELQVRLQNSERGFSTLHFRQVFILCHCPAANLEKVKENSRRWQAENPEKVKEKGRRYRAENPEKAKEDSRKYRAANPEKVKEDSRKYRAENREKLNEDNRKYYAANQEKILSLAKEKKYGVSAKDIEQMKLTQGGACAICKVVPKKLRVDHDHSSGKVRDLLCNTCNLALGLLKDSAIVARAAADYLDKHNFPCNEPI